MTTRRIERIVILGGGTAGWMTAAALARYLRRLPVRIELVESSEIGAIGVGEATIPSIRDFYRRLGMSDAEVIRASRATCKLGIEFEGWSGADDRYFHPFGMFGHAVDGIGFQHFWTRLRRAGRAQPLWRYSFPIVMARKGRFAPSPERPTSPLAVYAWALHFDAGAFAAHLRALAERHGVVRHDDKLQGVERHAESGLIEALVLESGRRLEGDLFIDCSGFRGLLIGEALGVPFEPWSDSLLCDRAVVVPSRADEAWRPYTRAVAQPAGWQWNIPLQHRHGNGYVYSSVFEDDERAAERLLAALPGEALDEPRLIRFTPGRRRVSWAHNCVAIGLSSGFIEPLESTSIAMIENGITRLIRLFPDWPIQPACVEEFNAMTNAEFDRIRDFIVLHYLASRRDDTEFWRAARAVTPSDILRHKLALFRQRGHFLRCPWEIFQDPSWWAIYDGNGIEPEHYDPAVDGYDLDRLARDAEAMRQAIERESEQAPPHRLFLERSGLLVGAGEAATA